MAGACSPGVRTGGADAYDRRRPDCNPRPRTRPPVAFAAPTIRLPGRAATRNTCGETTGAAAGRTLEKIGRLDARKIGDGVRTSRLPGYEDERTPRGSRVAGGGARAAACAWAGAGMGARAGAGCTEEGDLGKEESAGATVGERGGAEDGDGGYDAAEGAGAGG